MAISSVVQTGCGTEPGPIETGQEWREALNPVEGYTAEQTRAFHDMFDLPTWQVTQDNDYARYMLLRATEFFPHAVIHRSGPTAALVSAPREEVGRFALGGVDLEQYLASTPTDAFIVVHQGRVIYERYPRMRPTDRHLYWSVSKTLAGLMIGQLEAEGQVRLSEPVGQWDAVWADGDFYKGGFRGQGLYVSPSRDLVIAFFSSALADQKFWARELARSGLFRGHFPTRFRTFKARAGAPSGEQSAPARNGGSAGASA